MKGKVKLGFFGYILIFATILVGVFVVIGALLVLSPGMEIFGFTFIKNHAEVTIINAKVGETNVLLENLDINTISFDYNDVTVGEKTFSNAHYSITAVRDESKEVFSIVINDQVSGFTKYLDNTTSHVRYNYNALTKELSFTIEEPVINIYTSKHYEIKLVFPSDYVSNGISVKARTNSGDIIFGGEMDHKMSLYSVDFESTSGDITLTEDTLICGGGIKIKTVSGDINVSNQDNSIMQVLRPNVSLETEKGAFNVGDVYGNVNLKTEKSTIKIGNVYGNVTLDSVSGTLIGKNISGNFSATERVESTNIILNDVSGEILLPHSKNTDISINKAYDRVLIKTKDGDVKINEICDEAVVETEKGNIDVKVNCSKAVELKTTLGNVKANYKTISANHTITTTNGDITININVGLTAKLTLSTEAKIKTPWENVTNGNLTILRGSASENETARTILVKSTKGDITLTEQAA